MQPQKVSRSCTANPNGSGNYVFHASGTIIFVTKLNYRSPCQFSAFNEPLLDALKCFCAKVQFKIWITLKEKFLHKNSLFSQSFQLNCKYAKFMKLEIDVRIMNKIRHFYTFYYITIKGLDELNNKILNDIYCNQILNSTKFDIVIDHTFCAITCA